MPARALLLLVGVVTAAITIVGAFGPWATLGQSSAKGFDANAGKTVAAAGIAALLLIALSAAKRWRWPAILALIPSGIAGAVAGWYFASPAGKFVGAEGNTAIKHGWGLYLAALGGIVLFVLCLIEVAVAHGQRAAAPPPPPAAAPPPPPAAGPPPPPPPPPTAAPPPPPAAPPPSP